MEFSIGRKIFEQRREKGITQEALAEKMNVSAQAVSKWENDLSCPDVASLPKLAKELGITVDELLGGSSEPEVKLLPAEEINAAERIFRVIVDSAEGDHVRVNLPMSLVRVAVEAGLDIGQIQIGAGGDGAAQVLKNLDLKKIFELVDRGVIGKLVEVESAEGDVVIIMVE